GHIPELGWSQATVCVRITPLPLAAPPKKLCSEPPHDQAALRWLPVAAPSASVGTREPIPLHTAIASVPRSVSRIATTPQSTPLIEMPAPWSTEKRPGPLKARPIATIAITNGNSNPPFVF